MDPVTQGALGAAWAQLGVKPRHVKRATWLGVLGGVLPDADTHIRSSSDSLLSLEFHRHFTHALLFIPLGGLIAACLGHLLSRRRISIKEAYLPCTLGYASHGVLDACTSYGTFLFWPFSNERVAWSLVSIVDPVFTLVLLLAVVWTYRRRRRVRQPILAGIMFAALYIGLGAHQRQRALGEQTRLAASRGHSIERGDVKPSIANNIVYRSTYRAGDRYYVDAIRVGWFSTPKVYAGQALDVFDRAAFESQYALLPIKRRDIDRFAFFSDDYIIRHPEYPSVIGDLRYAAIPNRVYPLWGIDVTATSPDELAVFRQFNDNIDGSDRREFLQMLRGR